MNRGQQESPSGPVSAEILLSAPSGPALTAMAGTGAVTTALVSGAIPPNSPLVWPLVVLCLGSMAYDLGVRAVRYRMS